MLQVQVLMGSRIFGRGRADGLCERPPNFHWCIKSCLNEYRERERERKKKRRGRERREVDR